RFGGFTTDESILLGLKGFAAETLGWSVSASYGRHHADYFIFNTVNASMGPDTPTSFNPGDYIQTDVNLNLDLTYPVSDQLFLAAGLERRNEAFEIVEGQIESYIIGQPLASQGFQPATNGFSGFSKVAAGRWDRTNTALYVEADFEPIDPLVLSVALRSENFDDFGSTTNYKGAANFAVTDDLKLRGSYSTGFRAPTPGQQNAFNITTEFNFAKNDLVNNGTVPSTSAAAELYGGEPLDAEKSVNLSAGLVVDMAIASATIDFFDITVKDRLTISQDFALTETQRAQLIEEGITSAAGLQEFRFFTNAFDSATNGVDVVVSAPVGSGTLSLAYNYTSTEISLGDEQRTEFDRLNEQLGELEEDPESLGQDEKDKLAEDVGKLDAQLRPLNTDRIRELETNLPKQRGNLTLTQTLTERWNALGRASYYGEWYDSEDDRAYSGKVLFDLETSVSFNEGMSAIAIGAQNILNTYPDEHELAADRTGNKYSQFSPFGFGGAFWYVKYSYSR
ncbi:MAG: TonB-dependent receptor, partial [Candidatus Latescibacteria bacterium]|nr:TonB-dependent receptor [Candidatus Latescibacterota bacterium]